MQALLERVVVAAMGFGGASMAFVFGESFGTLRREQEATKELAERTRRELEEDVKWIRKQANENYSSIHRIEKSIEWKERQARERRRMWWW